MAKLVTIFGGSGFVGRYVARRMAQAGWRVRVAVRDPNKAGFVRPYGAVGQVEPVACNIRDDASVARALAGAQAVVNCVGILDQRGRNTFDAVQTEGAERVARLAAAGGGASFVHISAIGADAEAASDYARTKGEGEQAVLRHMPKAIVLRPSIIFGTEDDFFNRFGEMARISPAVPVVGAQTKFQPVYVDDVAQAAQKAVEGAVPAGIYELGGPDVQTFRQLMQRLAQVIRRRRLVIGLPFWIGRIMAAGFAVGNALSLGIVPRMITADQVKNLRHDNVVGPQAKGFDAFGIAPTSMNVILPDYLWRFRPDGQYSDIMQSARDLRS